MRAAAKTLLEVAANPKHLGAEVGVLAVLHTWGQNLTLHPHVHCVVTGGGLSLDESRWIAGRDDYFLPVPILRRVFRGKFLADSGTPSSGENSVSRADLAALDEAGSVPRAALAK